MTGASGHLGNNLIRMLSKTGKKVIAGVRQPVTSEILKGVNCEIVYTDVLDRASLEKAMQGVDILYHCAAVFRHWAPDPQNEIIKANLDGTRNVLETAAKLGVKKIIYVSSIVALDRNTQPMNEHGWNSDFSNPYNHSKTVSEQLAWEIAGNLDMFMISVLPAAIVGPHIYGRLTPTMKLLDSIISNASRVDIGFVQNIVDVHDVAAGMMEAADHGHNGKRYILGNEMSISTTRIFEIAHELYNEILLPPLAKKEYLLQYAAGEEAKSLVTGEEPALIRQNVELMYGADIRLDISAARADLGFAPQSPESAVKDALIHLYSRRKDMSL